MGAEGLDTVSGSRLASRSTGLAVAIALSVATSVSACVRPSATDTAPSFGPEYEMIDILPRDAIPAIDEPRFWEGQAALDNYPDDMLVLGVAFDGDARAYSIPYLSGHEIVNDSVGGRAITVTW